jgi:hypothetical protein
MKTPSWINPAIVWSWLRLYLSGVLTVVIYKLTESETPVIWNWDTLKAILIASLPPVLIVIRNYWSEKFPNYGPQPKNEIVVPNPNP